jgi:hypothetical protein
MFKKSGMKEPSGAIGKKWKVEPFTSTASVKELKKLVPEHSALA